VAAVSEIIARRRAAMLTALSGADDRAVNRMSSNVKTRRGSTG